MGMNRVVIGIPSGPSWESKFAMSLLFMVNHVTSHPNINGKLTNIHIHNKRGSILPQLRQGIIDDALKSGATHVLFLDTDQTFPETILHQLMSHQKQVVGCNIATKGFPSNPTARNRGKEFYGDLVYTNDDSTGIEQVWRVGTGIMLIDLNIFKREGMPERPWFTPRWNPETDAYVGEDWAFCECLDAAGVKVYIDHDASKEVTHIGRFEYGMDTVELTNGTEQEESSEEKVA